MIISILVLVVVVFYVGVIVERYSWVRNAKKKNRFIEVDGNLYSVYRVNVKLKDGERFKKEIKRHMDRLTEKEK